MRQRGAVNRRRFIGLLGASLAALLPAPARAAPAEAQHNEILREGIRRQRVIRLTYRGFTRLVEPHAIGLSAGGHRALLAWQIEGGSKSDPPTGWRTFFVDELRSATLTVRGFTPRPGYRADRSGLRAIELEVDRSAPSAAQDDD